MDDKEEIDHGVHFEGPNIIDYQKGKKMVINFESGVSGMLMHDALEVLIVIGL